MFSLFRNVESIAVDISWITYNVISILKLLLNQKSISFPHSLWGLRSAQGIGFYNHINDTDFLLREKQLVWVKVEAQKRMGKQRSMRN